MHHDFSSSEVLVLGAAGFIGQYLCKALVDAGASVRGYDLGAPRDDRVLGDALPKIRWTSGDLSDRGALAAAADGADYVFHLVSTTIPETSDRDLVRDLTTNVVPTLGLLDVVKRGTVKKVLYVSSGGTVYGVPKKIPISELHETDPICGYGIHKLAVEKYLQWYHHNHGLDYCVLRLSNPYGPAQVSERPQGAVGRFVYKALKRERIEIWGDGSVVRDYVYIDDVMDAFLRAMRYGGEKRVFNVGSGEGHSLLDLVDVIESVVGRSLDVKFEPARAVDVPLNILDISRIRSELAWEPKIAIRSGIERLVAEGGA